jgi:hypothetical protein
VRGFVLHEPVLAAAINIEHIEAAALTSWHSNQRTPMRPPEFRDGRRIGGRVLEAMRSSRPFSCQAGKDWENFTFEKNEPHGTSRAKPRFNFSDFFEPIRPLPFLNLRA